MLIVLAQTVCACAYSADDESILIIRHLRRGCWQNCNIQASCKNTDVRDIFRTNKCQANSLFLHKFFVCHFYLSSNLSTVYNLYHVMNLGLNTVTRLPISTTLIYPHKPQKTVNLTKSHQIISSQGTSLRKRLSVVFKNQELPDVIEVEVLCFILNSI